MNTKFLAYALGKLLQVFSLVMIVPAGIALQEVGFGLFPASLLDHRVVGFFVGIAGSAALGSLGVWWGNPDERLSARDGFSVVTFGWLLFSLFGSFPLFFYFQHVASPQGIAVALQSFTDAFFEVMSGFTTTGATILTDIESMPRGLLFWRSLTHWLGGMGIVTLGLVVFPVFGVAAYQMFRGEMPGPSKERLRPRMAQTATVLWGVYILLTLAQTLLLLIGGMGVFDALCHAFGTMATGGFSTRNASIGAFNSDFIDWTIIVFMFFAGINFILHYRALFYRDFHSLWDNRELRFYLLVIGVGVAVTMLFLLVQGIAPEGEITRRYRYAPLEGEALEQSVTTASYHLRSIYHVFRYAVFQVVSITTTTGYVTTDFDLWPNAVRVLLVLLMFFGGSAGSTAGGMKMVRVMIILRVAWREVRTMVQPRLILPLKIGDETIDEKLVGTITGFFTLFLLMFGLFSVVMALFIGDFATAVTSVVATMCNIGPGLAGVGATETYAWIPLGGKWVLIFCMLLGRLEIYTVLVALSPGLWKK